jgi:hypothetical protein
VYVCTREQKNNGEKNKEEAGGGRGERGINSSFREGEKRRKTTRVLGKKRYIFLFLPQSIKNTLPCFSPLPPYKQRYRGKKINFKRNRE